MEVAGNNQDIDETGLASHLVTDETLASHPVTVGNGRHLVTDGMCKTSFNEAPRHRCLTW